MADFETFWSVYPKRSPYSNPRRLALFAWQAAIKRGNDPDQLVQGATGYAALCKSKATPPEFICMASTFLSQERYEDFLRVQPDITRDILLGAR